MAQLHRAARERARGLRRESTDAETMLWRHLRNRGVGGVKFRRQVPIGRMTVDFASLERRLVIEVDGGQHATREARDRARDGALMAQGFTVLRFWNNDVLSNIEGVVTRILETLDKS